MSINAKKFLNSLNGQLTFAEALLCLRDTDEISQAELARKVGVSRGLICDIEKNRRIPSAKLVIKIAKALGYPEKVLLKYLLQDQLREAKAKFKVVLEAA